MHGSATAVRAAALVAARLARGRRAADAAEGVARMPVGKAARVGQQGAVLAAHDRADRAQVLEAAPPGGQRVDLRLLEGREIDGEVGNLLAQAGEDSLAGSPYQAVDLAQPADTRLGFGGTQVPVAPRRPPR